MRVILDNAALNAEVWTHFASKVVCLWVRAGSAEILHDGDSILTIQVGDRPVFDGLAIGTSVMARALESGTTLVISES